MPQKSGFWLFQETLDATKLYECLHEDYLTEIDPDTLEQMTKYKAFLFQEGLLVCHVLPER